MHATFCYVCMQIRHSSFINSKVHCTNCVYVCISQDAFFRFQYRPHQLCSVYAMLRWCNNSPSFNTSLTFSTYINKPIDSRNELNKIGKTHMKWKRVALKRRNSIFIHIYNSWCVRSIGCRDGADILYWKSTRRLIDFRRFV